jgi:hypothetical protein
MPAEDVAMSRSPLRDGILQRPGNVLLSNHLGEFLRAVFAGQDGVTHELEEMIIRDRGAMAMEWKINELNLEQASIRKGRFCRL